MDMLNKSLARDARQSLNPGSFSEMSD